MRFPFADATNDVAGHVVHELHLAGRERRVHRGAPHVRRSREPLVSVVERRYHVRRSVRERVPVRLDHLPLADAADGGPSLDVHERHLAGR